MISAQPRDGRQLSPPPLRRAAMFNALALAFGYPEPGFKEKLLRSLRVLGPTATSSRAGAQWKAFAVALKRTPQPAIGSEYARLFLGAQRVSLHETSYGDGRRIAGRPHELADIGGFYRAFGLTSSQVAPDLADHLCTELEFYSLLLVKQAYAETAHRVQHRAIARRCARAFLEQHLGRWIAALVNSLNEATDSPYYRSLATLLLGSVERECRLLRLRPRLLEDRLPRDDMQAETFGCPREEGETATAFS